MEESFDIKDRLKNILALCAKANPYGTAAQKDADRAFWEAVMTLDGSMSHTVRTVTIGRFVRLPAKDSYAYYIVIKVTKKTVKLVHIPYGLKYESPYVRDGEADLSIIETTLEWHDRIATEFAQLGKRQIPSNPPMAQ